MAERLIVTSAEGGKLVPFARARVRALRFAGHDYITQHYSVQGMDVRVTLQGADEVIEVRGGGIEGYEFWANEDFQNYPSVGASAGGLGSLGHVDVYGVDSDGNPVTGDGKSDFAAGSAVFIDGKGRALPRYSTALTPAEGQEPGWPTVSPRRATALTPSSGHKAEPGYFYTKWSWQDQKLAEHCWWRKGGKGFMTSAIGFNYGLASNAMQRGPGTTSLTYFDNYALRWGGDRQEWPLMGDAGFDIKACSYGPKGVRVGASRQQGGKVWYRRACIQSVVLPGGGKRDYVIHSDTHGRFTVWPLGEYQNTAKYPELYEDNPAAYADLPPSVAKVFLPPYPDWVTVPDTSEDVGDQHWTWQFNSTGTRCATVAHQKVEAWVWMWRNTKPVNAAQYHQVDGGAFMREAHYNRTYASQGTGGFMDGVPQRYADGSIRDVEAWGDWVYMRVREYRKRRSAGGTRAFAHAYMVDGVLVGCSIDTGNNPTVNFNTREWKPVPSPETFDPAFTYLPGLVEFGITVTASDTDPYDFSVAFELLQDQPYEADKSRYLVDAAYYVATPRTQVQDAALGLAQDDLLVADVQVGFRPGRAMVPGLPDWPGDPVNGDRWKALIAGCQYAQGGRYIEGDLGTPPGESNRRYHDHIDEPHLESALTGEFRAEGVHAYYTVRRHADSTPVKRLCLGHDLRWERRGLDVMLEFLMAGSDQRRTFTTASGETVDFTGRVFMPQTVTATSAQFEVGLARAQYISTYHMPATFETKIDVADIRFLNFATRTYLREQATPSTYERVDVTDPVPAIRWNCTPVRYLFSNWGLPNHHLRIHGEPVRSILYREDIEAFGADPAANLITMPEGVVLLPSIPRGGAPCGNEGVALAMQEYFAAQHIMPSLMPGGHIPAHPKGHWAVCLNRSQAGFEFGDDYGEPYYTGALAVPLPASTEGNKTWFDHIHRHGGTDTTHKDAFNTAFGQSRDYSFWDDPDMDGEAIEYGGFMAGALWVRA